VTLAPGGTSCYTPPVNSDRDTLILDHLDLPAIIAGQRVRGRGDAYYDDLYGACVYELVRLASRWDGSSSMTFRNRANLDLRRAAGVWARTAFGPTWNEELLAVAGEGEDVADSLLTTEVLEQIEALRPSLSYEQRIVLDRYYFGPLPSALAVANELGVSRGTGETLVREVGELMWGVVRRAVA